MYKIAIPSYNRVEGIIKKTLAFLSRYNYPKELIYIFVNTEELKTEYKTKISKELYGHIILTNQPKGICLIRNYITNYFDEGEKYISMDDDIHSIQQLNEDGKLVIISSIQDLFEKGYKKCEENNASLWGLYPMSNAFYMSNKKEEYTTDLKFIVGGFMGIINRKIQLSIDMKEDYELTLESYMRDKCIIRFNHVAVKHNIYTKTGGIGLNQQERINDNKISCEYFLNKYPDFVKLNRRREGEILLQSPKTKKEELKTKLYQFKIDKCIFDKLLPLLDKYKIPVKAESGYNKQGFSRNGRKGFPRHRACCYGYLKYKVGGKIDLSYETKKHPEIYEELLTIGKLICPFDFTSIMVNNNVVCPKHKDNNNVGDSLLVSLGEYEGCNIIIDNKEYNTRYSPVVFNGSKLEHWNTPLISGNKYSLIFFSIKYPIPSTVITQLN